MTALPSALTEADALARDAVDPLSAYRDRFLFPHGPSGPDGLPAIYLAGQSLGLQSAGVRPAVERQLDRWASLGVEGHFAADDPWFTYDETFRGPMSRIVGARPAEVAILNTLTVNLHLLLASFFRPDGARRRILTDAPLFPSDRHALASHLAFRGLDPVADLIVVGPRVGEDLVRIEDLEGGPRGARGRPSRSRCSTGSISRPVRRSRWPGSRLPAHAVGAIVGWQLAHGAGNLPLALHDDDVDFAVWCTYKYLNGGPGSVGAIFVLDRHTRPAVEMPRLTGWWGHARAPVRSGRPVPPAAGAAAWKMSTSPLFNMVPLAVSLAIFDEVGMPALRERSIRLTSYLEDLLAGLGIEVITPRDPDARGAQLSLRFPDATAVLEALEGRGVIADLRAPDIIRMAPIPLYGSFHELWRLGEILRLIR